MDNKNVGAVLEDLIATLEDGYKGFADAAEKLAADGHADLAQELTAYSGERRQFADELRMAAQNLGHEIKEDGSGAAALHRGWMAIKDALTGDDAHAVLAAAESGEDHAVSEYEEALASDLPADVREAVARQAMRVRAAHDAVKAMRDQN